MSEPLQIGLLVFPAVTQLDFTGPLQVFSRLPGAKIHLVWKRIEPALSRPPAKLHAVRVYETADRYVDYFGDAR